MATYTPRLRQILRQHGCYVIRAGKGDHEIWYSPISNQRFPVDSKICSPIWANIVLQQAGLPKSF